MEKGDPVNELTRSTATAPVLKPGLSAALAVNPEPAPDFGPEEMTVIQTVKLWTLDLRPKKGDPRGK